jgi:translation initiation factor 5
MIPITGLMTMPIDDPWYRYKMPRLIVQEKKGSTLLGNVEDVATSLNRNPSEIIKFFGYELGTRTTICPELHRYCIQGSHLSNDLQRLLDEYIEFYVLCHQCRYPETHYIIHHHELFQECESCGYLTPCDRSEKMEKFLLKVFSNRNNPSRNERKGSRYNEVVEGKSSEKKGRKTK